MNAPFAKMGADVRVNRVDRSQALTDRWGRQVRTSAPIPGLAVDVDAKGFNIDAPKEVALIVLDVDARDQHLLLMASDEESGVNQKFLCGHDERDWFAAAVPAASISVVDAKDRLMPPGAKRSFASREGRNKRRHKRHNKGYIRQGEWFFIPQENVRFTTPVIFRNEPFVRPGGGKPHIIEEIIRDGGEAVYVHRKYALYGITRAAYEQRKESVRRASGWVIQRRNPQVFARGKVRHPDHKTIVLNGWHRVEINREDRPDALVFID